MILFFGDQIDHIPIPLDPALGNLPLGFHQILYLFLLRICPVELHLLILTKLMVFQKIIENLLAGPNIF